MAEQIVQIKSLPGIKRDGTTLEGDPYVDGQWVRFQRSLPRKIGGYRSINKFLKSTARTLHGYTLDRQTYIHAGSSNRVERFFIDGGLNSSIIGDRTPATLAASAANLWQFDVAYDTTDGSQLVAQVAPNLDCICNGVGGQLFTGDLLGTAPLTPVTAVPANFNCSGGVVALPPYTFAFGNDGYVAWSIPNGPDDFISSGAGNAYITGQKVIKGMPLRGGPGNSPSGLFWSADALIRASYVGGTAVFQFDTISTQSSILSAACVIEYDGIFYWIGTDRFLSFNGVVREVPNAYSTNYFFDNLNYAQRQKVFAMKVPRFGEIWWCYPAGDSVEPNRAVIYNVRENVWYDTDLPNGGRGAGLSAAVFPSPIMTGVLPTFVPTTTRVTQAGATRVLEGVAVVDRITEESGDAQYRVWVHERGTDEVDGLTINPILSYFETSEMSLPITAQVNKAMQVLIVEPDFVQSGPMTVQIRGHANARSPEVGGEVKTFVAAPTTPDEQIVFMKEQRRQLRFRFSSNVVGGNYEMGLVLAHLQPADGTVLG